RYLFHEASQSQDRPRVPAFAASAKVSGGQISYFRLASKTPSHAAAGGWVFMVRQRLEKTRAGPSPGRNSRTRAKAAAAASHEAARYSRGLWGTSANAAFQSSGAAPMAISS